MIINDYKIDVIQSSKMKVDGGMLFSSMPKTNWEKLMKPDTKNLIELGINQLLIRGHGITMLVDTGIGKSIQKNNGSQINKCSNIIKSLRNYDIEPEDITHVVFTHLHHDHCGGATLISHNQVMPAFKNACHIIQKEEWSNACNPDKLSKKSYFPHNFLPLLESKKVSFVNSDIEIALGISLELTGGHTQAHQMLVIEQSDCQLFFTGDICPTEFHLKHDARASFDVYPDKTIKMRIELLKRATRKKSYMVFPHSAKPCIYCIDSKNENVIIRAINET